MRSRVDETVLDKLTCVNAESERVRYKVVRRDTMQDVAGVLILSASAHTGLCLIRDDAGCSKEYNFGPDGLRIVGR